MSISDPVADMITRIRNGQQARRAYVTCSVSKLRKGILDVLKKEGFITDFTEEESGENSSFPELKIFLKYHEGTPVIKEIKRVSKPGRRVYSSIKKLPKNYNGLGISIVSTPSGVMSDYDARQANVGGEILCSVF